MRPGEWFAGKAPARVRTLLGSCVSITAWHAGTHSGAMCHFMLPRRGKPGGEVLDARYADEAVELMRQGLAGLGVNLLACDLKVFGGAQMFAHMPGTNTGEIGGKNIAAARRLLERMSLTARSSDVGGTAHREVVFDLGTGHVWCRNAARRVAIQ